MPNFAKKIVYLSAEQYQELVANGSIVVDGVMITYDPNDLYVTPQADPVIDVQIGNSSIVNNDIANIPIAGYGQLGVVQQAAEVFGIRVNENGQMSVSCASATSLKQDTGNAYKPIASGNMREAAFYGLAKAAGDSTQSASSNAVGTYTDDAKGKIQSMLGISGLIATDESTLTASKSYAIGERFLVKGALYKATAAIVQGTSIVTTGVNANCEATTVDEELASAGTVQDVQINGTSILQNGVANIPMSAAGVLGVVQPGNGLNVSFDGTIAVSPATSSAIKSGDTTTNRPITPGYQHAAVFYGLAKAAGDATQKNSSNAVGTYTDDAKSAIRTMLGVPSTSDIPDDYVQDIQIGGDSIVEYGVANIPWASTNGARGVVTFDSDYGIDVTDYAEPTISPADSEYIQAGTDEYKPIVPYYQHESVFYGLAKAAGDATQAEADTQDYPVGTYTNGAKTAIKTMLGVTDPISTLSGLTDVQLQSPIYSGQVLSFVNNKWRNISISSSQAFNEWTDTNNDVGLGAGKIYLCAGPQGEWPVDALTLRNAVANKACILFGDSDDDITPIASFNDDYINGQYIYTAVFGDRVYKSDPTEDYMYFYATISPSSSNGGYVVDISSTAPSIVGEANYRYNCGEVTTISITPPAAGTIDVLFESGSTAAALTVPNTVKWPGWFDPDDLDTDTIYEILIVDGVYGSVMTWNA